MKKKCFKIFVVKLFYKNTMHYINKLRNVARNTICRWTSHWIKKKS